MQGPMRMVQLWLHLLCFLLLWETAKIAVFLAVCPSRNKKEDTLTCQHVKRFDMKVFKAMSCWDRLSTKDTFEHILLLGPPSSALLRFFGWEGSPTKIDKEIREEEKNRYQRIQTSQIWRT